MQTLSAVRVQAILLSVQNLVLLTAQLQIVLDNILSQISHTYYLLDIMQTFKMLK